MGFFFFLRSSGFQFCLRIVLILVRYVFVVQYSASNSRVYRLRGLAFAFDRLHVLLDHYFIVLIVMHTLPSQLHVT